MKYQRLLNVLIYISFGLIGTSAVKAFVNKEYVWAVISMTVLGMVFVDLAKIAFRQYIKEFMRVHDIKINRAGGEGHEKTKTSQ